MKRVLFIDCWKGFLMFYIVLLHPMLFIVFNGAESSGTLTGLPLIGKIAILPLALIATWAPLFAFCSGVANAYVMKNLMNKNNPNLKKVVTGQMFNSIALFIAHIVFAAFFEHTIEFNGEMQYSILGGFLETGEFHWPGLNILHFDTLALMAVSTFFLSLILGIIWRKGGHKKTRKNYIILALIAVAWFLITPELHSVLEPVFWESLTNKDYFTGFILSIFVAPRQSTFPNAGFVFFGAIFGLAIANKEKVKDIKRFGYGFVIFFSAIELLIIIIDGIGMEDFVAEVVPIKIYLINLIIFVFVATLMTHKVEYGTPEKRVKFAKKTVKLRRWGLMTLTIFILEGPISVIFAFIFNKMVPGFTENIFLVLIYIGVLEGFWAMAMRLWERVDYKYTFEHFVVAGVGRIRGRKSNKLNAAKVLHDPCGNEICIEVENNTNQSQEI